MPRHSSTRRHASRYRGRSPPRRDVLFSYGRASRARADSSSSSSGETDSEEELIKSASDSDDSKSSGGAPRKRTRSGGGRVLLGVVGFVALAVVGALAYFWANRQDTTPDSSSAPRPTPLNQSPLSTQRESSGTVSSTAASTPLHIDPSKATISTTESSVPLSASVNASNPAGASPTKPAGAVQQPVSSKTAWIPVGKAGKVRGVNAGSLFVFEPWMAGDAWKAMGCDGTYAEWDCVRKLGKEKAQAVFENHWNTWYSEEDFKLMAQYGLNTLRLPLGFWTVDEVVYDSEYYARGSWKYVTQVIKWAKQHAISVILDLHALPGVSALHQSFAGQTVDKAGFYGNQTEFARAYAVLKNWTTEVLTNEDLSNVVAIGVINEPERNDNEGLLDQYYPGAQKAIRDAEKALGVSCKEDTTSCLGIQYMGTTWGAGDPRSSLTNLDHVFFDDHDYVQWAVKTQTKEGYVSYTCSDERATSMAPLIVGEFSFSTMSEGDLPNAGKDWLSAWAQNVLIKAELGAGWTFWSWKAENVGAAWSYQQAVKDGSVKLNHDEIGYSFVYMDYQIDSRGSFYPEKHM